MAQEAKLPIHELARLWQRSEDATLAACVDFRRKIPPGWNLSWFRDYAPSIIAGALSRASLIAAVEENVPIDSQRSVTEGIDLFLGSIAKHKWKGENLAPKNYVVTDGPSVLLRPVGRYFSALRRSEFVLALQPRSESAPNLEQLCIWHSAISYGFCQQDQNSDVMIVDLSKSTVSGKRQLSELTSAKLKKLDKGELDDRLRLVSNCYERAILIVPDRPKRHRVETIGQKRLL